MVAAHVEGILWGRGACQFQVVGARASGIRVGNQATHARRNHERSFDRDGEASMTEYVFIDTPCTNLTLPKLKWVSCLLEVRLQGKGL